MVESDSLPEMVHVGDNSEITMEGAPASHQLPQAAGGEVSAAAAAPVTNASGRSLARRDTSSSQHSHSGLAKLAIRHEVLHSLQEAVVVVGRDEKVELYNEAAFELWGYPEDTIVGAHYSVLFGRDVDMSPHNKSQSRILTKNKVCMPIGYRTPFMLGQLHIQACEIPKLIKTYAYHAGLVRNSETTAKDGNELFLRISHSHLQVVNAEGRSSTACRIIAENVAEDPEFVQLHAVVEMSVNAIISCTAEGEISSFNDAASKIFGYAPDQALRLPFLRLIHEDVKEDSAAFLSRMQGKTSLEIFAKKSDGTPFPARMSVTKATCSGVTFFTAMVNDITDEKNRLAQLYTEQRRTSAIMNSALNAIITTDAKGRLELINTSAGRVFGLHPQDSIGTSLANLIIKEDGASPAEEEMSAFLKAASGTVQELVGQRLDGSKFPMRMSVSEVDEEGIHLFTAILRDVTKEKAAQAQLHQEQRRTSAIMNSALNAIITTDAKGRLELINTSAGRVFGLHPQDSIGTSLASLIVREDGTNPAEEEMTAFLKERAGTVQELVGQRLDGSKFPMRMSVSEVDEEGIHLFTAILRDVTKEKAAQAELYQEQRRTSAIMNSALNAIITTDAKGRLELINTSAGRVFGLHPQDSIGTSLASLIVKEDGSRPAEEEMTAFLKERAGTVQELVGQRLDGSKFPMRMSVSEVDEEGIHLFTAILRDVTKEKAAQAELYQEQRRTSAIMNSALNAIITTDAKGRLELINTSAGRVFGLHPQDSIGTSLANLIVKEDGTKPTEEEMTAFLKERAGTVQELVGQRLDGSKFPMRMSVSEVDEEGIHLFTAILRDVSKEKAAQAHIEASQEIIRLEKSKLAALLDSTVEGFLVIDNRGVIESFNKAAEVIFGYSSDEVIGQSVNMLMLSKHAKRHNQHMKRHCESSANDGVVGHSREIKALRKNGTEFRCLITISETFVNGEHLFTAVIRDLSNELLLQNMMPPSIAARLRAKETINDKHDNVSILFADIVGFTKLSSKLTPFEVVSFLNDIFQTFDELVDTYQLEKIKTIGDCYMVVSGVPEDREDHALRLGCFAIEMRDALLKYNKEKKLKYPLNMRIGLHCGPVIAGVVGKRKYLYDIWGDAVNVASRMESTGISGSIQVSADYAAEVNQWLDLQDRGCIEVKGKGMMRTHILHGVRNSRAMDLQQHLTALGIDVRHERKPRESMVDEETAGGLISKRDTPLNLSQYTTWSPFSAGTQFKGAEQKPGNSKPHGKDEGSGSGHEHQVEDERPLQCHVSHLLTPQSILKDLQTSPSAAAADTPDKATHANHLAAESSPERAVDCSATLSTNHAASPGDDPSKNSLLRVLSESTPQKSAAVLSPLDLPPRDSVSERSGQLIPPGVAPLSPLDDVSPAVTPKETNPRASEPTHVSAEAARRQSDATSEAESAKMARFTFFSNLFKLGKRWRYSSMDDVTLIHQAQDQPGTSIPHASAPAEAWHRRMSCSHGSLDSVMDVHRPSSTAADIEQSSHALHEPWQKRRPRLSNLRRSLFGPSISDADDAH